MFNKKLLNVLAYILAALLIFQALFMLVTFILSYFMDPENAMIPAEFGPYFALLETLGVLIFFYLVVAMLKKILVCDHHGMMAVEGKKMLDAPAKPARRIARKPRRKTTKKK